MKRWTFIILVAAVSGLGAFGVSRQLAPTPVATSETDGQLWLQKEFKLTSAQAEVIEKLHRDYQPVCDRHCSLISNYKAKLAHNPDDAELRKQLRQLEDACRSATAQHLTAVASVMAPEQGKRFLELVGPKVSQHDHTGALPLR